MVARGDGCSVRQGASSAIVYSCTHHAQHRPHRLTYYLCNTCTYTNTLYTMHIHTIYHTYYQSLLLTYTDYLHQAYIVQVDPEKQTVHGTPSKLSIS